jgi:hypothetical protein
LEDENRKLKLMVAGLKLKNRVIKDVRKLMRCPATKSAGSSATAAAIPESALCMPDRLPVPLGSGLLAAGSGRRTAHRPAAGIDGALTGSGQQQLLQAHPPATRADHELSSVMQDIA